jgi:hypothetical protein
MLLTESEAQCKQCPEMQQGFSVNLANSGNGAYSGTMYPIASPIMCIATRCMAWRWGDDMKTKGYCGKFGKPYPGE